MKSMKARDLIRYVESHGWEHIETKGSHMQYGKRGHRVTIPGPANREVPPGTVRAIKKTVEEVG